MEEMKAKSGEESAASQSIQRFEVQIDKLGRVFVPAHIRRRLQIYGKAACIEGEIRVKEIYNE